MPVVGSSAYNTAGQITSLVRSLLNDSQGNLFTDTLLLPYANSAYRKLQRSIGNAGGGGFIQDDVLLVVPAVTQTDTSLQVSISDSTAPPNQLPTDLLVPVKIWERPDGRFSGNGGPFSAWRAAFARTGRDAERLGMARRRTLFSGRDAGYANPP